MLAAAEVPLRVVGAPLAERAEARVVLFRRSERADLVGVLADLDGKASISQDVVGAVRARVII